jgi:signal transduction histidine kinase
MLDHMSTMFAPAARATAEELAADVAYFGGEHLLQQFFGAVPEMFVVLNEQRQIVFANRSMLKALHLAGIYDAAGQRLGEALHCTHAFEPGDDPLGSCGTTEFCRECGAVRAMLNGLRGLEDVQECRISLADGAALDLRVSACPFRRDCRNYVLFAATDISHEKRRQVLERIFFHDILNTAGGMLGVAEVLRTGTAEEVEEFKDAVALLANSLVDEIKAQQVLIAAERGELAVQPGRVNSLTLLCEVRNAYLNHEVAMGRQISVDPQSDTVFFTSDPLLLRRVLGNLLKNALEAARPGETVTLACQAVPDGVEFTVHNPGVMPRNVQLQIFQRSFSSKGDGRGLGSYSVKLLTERYLRGAVAFDSTPEHGTTFRVRYPLQGSDA